MSNKSKKTASNKEETSPKKVVSPPKKDIAKKTPKSEPKQKSGVGVAWLAIILVLTAIGVGYFGFMQLKKQIDQLSTSTGSAKQSTTALSNELQSTASDINSNVSSLSAQLTALEQSSADNINRLQKQVGKNRLQWRIAEAEYLISVANTRLMLAGDIDTAIVALQAADQRLKENGDPLTFPVRKQLAKEINILKSTEQADTVGISSQLIALEDAVAEMNISEPHAGSVQAPEIGKGKPSSLPENIQETFNDAWANFSKLIVVRRNDEPMAALMTPERVELIRKNLSLKLEAARLALINQDETLYKTSISISMKWLGDYFDAENSAVKTALEQLETLKNTPITTPLPSIALSLKMLRDLPLLDHSNPTKAVDKSVKKASEPKKPAITKKAINRPIEKTSVVETPSPIKKADEKVPASEEKIDITAVKQAFKIKL